MEEELYLISHITLITGLSDRTIRNYIASGILKGEKINGIWHFTPEEVDAFIKNPAVRPSIIAKNNSVVYDFMLNDSKKEEETALSSICRNVISKKRRSSFATASATEIIKT